MPIETTLQTKFKPKRTESAPRSLITGQTQDTTNFTAWRPHGSYHGKQNISTSRPVDGGMTGSNWAVTFFRHWSDIDNTIGGGIVINDLLPTDSEMIISGYFFRGRTPLAADRPAGGGTPPDPAAGSYYDPNDDSLQALFEVVYETDSSQFSNFSTSESGKYKLDYVSPYDDLSDSSKWSYHIGLGPLPVYNGHNVGVKGGWEYSSGRSDSSYAQAVGPDGIAVQTDSRLYSSNFDTLGSGLTRFFRLIVVNKTGANVKLKLLFRGGPDLEGNKTTYGLYDFQTQIVSYTDKFVGITTEQPGSTVDTPDALRPLLGTSASGLVESSLAGSTYPAYFTNLNSSSPNSSCHIDNDTVEGASTLGSADDSGSYKIEIPMNFRLYSSDGTFALPITGMEPWVTRVSNGVKVGGSNDYGDEGTGAHVLGPMPASGKVQEVRFHTGDNTAYNNGHISVLKLDGLNPGESWSGGAGVQTIVSAMNPTSPTSGSSRDKIWTNINASFSAGDSLLLTLTNTSRYGWVAATIVIEMNLTGHD